MQYESPNRSIPWIAKQALIETTLANFLAEIENPKPVLPLEVGQTLGVIHGHLFDPELNVGAVRRRCGIRSNNFSARFRLAVGIGLRDYIELQRIEASKSLLQHASLEIYLIAQAVGYSHSETFFRAFQRLKEAYTPQQWREQHLAGDPPGPARRGSNLTIAIQNA